MNSKDIDIAVCYHKESKIFKNDCIKPIYVGKDCTDKDLPMSADNTGDNISYKNFHYAELTAIYWLWKNSNAKIKGIMHYRRLLDISGNNLEKEDYTYKYNDINDEEIFLENLGLTKKNIENILENSDIIVKNKSDLSAWSKFTIKTHYEFAHIAKHIEYATNIIANKYPEFLETWKKVLNGSASYFNNIFIMKSVEFDKYCELLFGILFELEKHINLYDIRLAPETFNARWAGFLGERLTGAYIIYQNSIGKKLAHYPAVILEDKRSWLNVSTYENLKIKEKPIVIGDKDKPIISVCLAVYNNFKYLKQALDSIVNSTLRNIEIICINDGSADDSLDILKEYVNKDSRIIAVNNSNEGLCSVINISMEKAKGKYIHFMDSCDYIDKDFLANMVETAEKYNSEIVISTHRTFNEKHLETCNTVPLMHTLINKENLNIKKNQDLMSISYHLFDKIFKLSYISDIKFSIIGKEEEIWFWYNALLKSDRISIQRKCCYNHRINVNSARINVKNIKNLFSVLEKTYKLFNGDYEYLKPMFDMFVYSLIFYIRDMDVSLLLKNDEFKKYFYNKIKKLTDNISIQKEYEKYFSWFGFDNEILEKIREFKTIKDFDKIFNPNGNREILKILYNYVNFKIKKDDRKEKYRKIVYEKIKFLPNCIPINILGLNIKIKKSLFAKIEKDVRLLR